MPSDGVRRGTASRSSTSAQNSGGEMPSQSSTSAQDPEKGRVEGEYFHNSSIKEFAWRNVTVKVRDRAAKTDRAIVENAYGVAKAGEICALVGPSGCGKTTLLNVLARRHVKASKVESDMLVNGGHMSNSNFKEVACYLEDRDAFIGSLTVRETLEFSSRLANPSSLTREDRDRLIDSLLQSFGLTEQANTLIGTSLRQGISMGEKRRVGIASQLITCPQMLFLDEPTSGLDSAAGFKIMEYLKRVVQQSNLILVISIHQPSAKLFGLLDQVTFLSGGKVYYFGPTDGVMPFCESVNDPVPSQENPSEHILELVDDNFTGDETAARERLDELHQAWECSSQYRQVHSALKETETSAKGDSKLDCPHEGPGCWSLTRTLLHRNFVKSYRDLVAYGLRVLMCTCVGVLTGTIWFRLDLEQSSIPSFMTALFFGSGFSCFLIVGYVPAFLEDRQQYLKDRHNGLYGPTVFLIANFLIGTPYVFLCACGLSVTSYWIVNFLPTAEAFFTALMWTFLNLLASESVVILIATVFPNFIVSLVLYAFTCALFLGNNGFLVRPPMMNHFYKYAFYYWDYQRYVFQGLLVNEFKNRVYSCGTGCHCTYDSPLASQCKILGEVVLDQYDIPSSYSVSERVAIMMAIILAFRLAAWAALKSGK